jgi:hypothetical protein
MPLRRHLLPCRYYPRASSGMFREEYARSSSEGRIPLGIAVAEARVGAGEFGMFIELAFQLQR